MSQELYHHETILCCQNVSQQMNYITVPQGPECTTMTRELCSQAENTLYTRDGEFFAFSFIFLVDGHEVHGPFRQMASNNKIRRERERERELQQQQKKQFHEILIRYIY